MHLLTLQKTIEEYRPEIVVIDPLTNLTSIGSSLEVKSMLTRLIDFLKMKQVTAIFTSLTNGSDTEISAEVGISSLMDTWLLVRNMETGSERNRGLYVLKSRGMAHSTQVREFRLSDHGVELVDVYVGPEGILTGSARTAQEGREKSLAVKRQAEVERHKREMERNRSSLQAQISALQAAIELEEEKYQSFLADEDRERQLQAGERGAQVRARQRGTPNGGN